VLGEPGDESTHSIYRLVLVGVGGVGKYVAPLSIDLFQPDSCLTWGYIAILKLDFFFC
jgi:hypothetical protein